LIHAHWSSLIMWDSWAEALKDNYRVIRFDLTSHGLTGPDPSGDYTLERTVFLMEELLAQLGVSDMYLGGTSVGGTVAMHYAAKHPELVNNLILISPGTLNTRIKDPTKPLEVPKIMDVLTIITPRAMFSGMLNQGFGDKSKLTDEMIDRWHEMQMREGQRVAEMARMRQYVGGDIPKLMTKLTAPTLVMWGEANPVVPIDQAYKIVDMLENATVRLITYAGVGHMAVLEAPEATSADIRAYLDEMEAQTKAEMLMPEIDNTAVDATDEVAEPIEESAP
jgi:pimeloyl-ACP methyl ester carboxylesterase